MLSAVALLFSLSVIVCLDSVTPGMIFGHPLCMYKQNVSGIPSQNSLLPSVWFFITFGVLWTWTVYLEDKREFCLRKEERQCFSCRALSTGCQGSRWEN